MAYTWSYARADEGPVALEMVALVGPTEPGALLPSVSSSFGSMGVQSTVVIPSR